MNQKLPMPDGLPPRLGYQPHHIAGPAQARMLGLYLQIDMTDFRQGSAKRHPSLTLGKGNNSQPGNMV
jgi:hypothetical protein